MARKIDGSEIPDGSPAATPKYDMGRRPIEYPIPIDRRHEAVEQPRTVPGVHFRFGKRSRPVRNPDEHSLTGISDQTLLSNGFIDAVTYGDLTGRKFGIESLGKYVDDCPSWSTEGGGIGMGIARVGNRAWVGIGRHNGLWEGGATYSGRMYSENDWCAVPYGEWSVSFIPQLAEQLKPQMLQEHAMGTLPPIDLSTDILDQELPVGWMSGLSYELLGHVITGLPISVEDRNMSIKDFLQSVYYCLLCLPEALARQVSFAAGVPVMDGTARIMHGASARTRIRKINDKWDIRATLTYALTREYIKTLWPGLQTCHTPRDVMKAVANLPSELTQRVERSMFPDGAAQHTPPPDAVKGNVAEVRAAFGDVLNTDLSDPHKT